MSLETQSDTSQLRDNSLPNHEAQNYIFDNIPKYYYCNYQEENFLNPNIGDIVHTNTPMYQTSDGLEGGYEEFKVYGSTTKCVSSASVTIPKNIASRFGLKAFEYYANLTKSFYSRALIESEVFREFSIGVEIDIENDQNFKQMFNNYDLNGCTCAVFIFKNNALNKVYLNFGEESFEFTYETMTPETFEIAKKFGNHQRDYTFFIKKSI